MFLDDGCSVKSTRLRSPLRVAQHMHAVCRLGVLLQSTLLWVRGNGPLGTKIYNVNIIKSFLFEMVKFP